MDVRHETPGVLGEPTWGLRVLQVFALSKAYIWALRRVG